MSESTHSDNSFFNTQKEILQLYWFWSSILIGAASLWLISLHYANDWEAHFRDISFAIFFLLSGFIVIVLFFVRNKWKQIEQFNFLVQTLPIVIMLCLLILGKDSWLEQAISEIPPIPTGPWLVCILFVVFLWNLYLGAFHLIAKKWIAHKDQNHQRREVEEARQRELLVTQTSRTVIEELINWIRGK